MSFDKYEHKNVENKIYDYWEKNDLFFAQIDLDGEIQKIKKFSNQLIDAKKNVSFFQPYWISETILVCSEDSSGWWNLLFIDVSEIENIFIKKTGLLKQKLQK